MVGDEYREVEDIDVDCHQVEDIGVDCRQAEDIGVDYRQVEHHPSGNNAHHPVAGHGSPSVGVPGKKQNFSQD